MEQQQQQQQPEFVHHERQKLMHEQRLMHQQKMLQQQNMTEHQKVVDQQVVDNSPNCVAQPNSTLLNVEQETEKQDNEVEMQGEMEEEEVTTMKYHGAEQFLKEEMKQLVTTKATEMTLFTILNEQKTDLLQHISDRETELQHLQNENEMQKINIELTENEIKELQQRIQSDKEILEKTQSFVQQQAAQFRNVEKRIDKAYSDACEHVKARKEWELSASDILAKLEDEVKAKKQILATFDEDDDLDRERIELELKIAARREYLESLHKQEEELEPKPGKENELEEMQEILRVKIETLKELERKQEQVRIETETNITMMNRDLEERKQRLEDMETERRERLEKNEKILKEIDIERQKITEAELNYTDIKAKLSETTKSIEDGLEQLRKQQADFSAKEADLQETLQKLQKDVDDSKMNYDNMQDKLEQLGHNYSSQMEEKARLLADKFDVDRDLLKQEAALDTLNVLDKKISKVEEQNSQLEEQLKILQEDTTVQVLTKEKAYLESSMVYLTEKLDITNKTIEAEASSVGSLEDKVKLLDEKIREIQKSCEELEEEMKMKKIKGSTKAEQPVIGILKPTPTPTTTKQNTVSPKRVQFNNEESLVHEFEKGSSGSFSAELPPPSSGKKSFDQLMEEFRKSQTPKLQMKRKLPDFDL